MQTETSAIETAAPMLPQVFPEERVREARELDAAICGDLDWLNEKKDEAQHRIARIGGALQRMAENGLYEVLGFPSIHRYMRDRVSQREHLNPTQLYAYKEVAEQLASHATPAEIEAMGITNASILAKAKRATGRAPSAEVIAAAQEQKTDEFKQTVAVEFELRPEEPRPKGKWYDFGGFFAEPDERKLIERAIECAKRVDPVIPVSDSEAAQRKEVFLRFCMEFLSTHEETVTLQAAGRINKGDVV